MRRWQLGASTSRLGFPYHFARAVLSLSRPFSFGRRAVCSAWTSSSFAYRCTDIQPSGRRQDSRAGPSRSHSVDSDVEEVDVRGFFGEPELPLVVGSRAGHETSGVRITARVPILSPADLPLGATVTPMIAAPSREGSSSLGHSSAVGVSQEGGAPGRRRL